MAWAAVAMGVSTTNLLAFCAPTDPLFYAACLALAAGFSLVCVALTLLEKGVEGFAFDYSPGAMNSAIIYLNPVSATFGILFFLALEPVGKFVWYLAQHAYSDELVLMALHAAAGGALGAWFGGLRAVLGSASAASFVGVLQYELVSKRWLKLVPAAAAL